MDAEEQAEKKPLRVFLCHGSNDKPTVRQIFDRLEIPFVDPWLDEKRIKGGQDWDLEIRKAVRNSDVIVVCLTRSTLSKEGYIQKEIRQALDVAAEKPEGAIFIIPIRLEKCDVPDSLRKWQWIDYFEEGGNRRLLESLLARRESRSIHCSGS